MSNQPPTQQNNNAPKKLLGCLDAFVLVMAGSAAIVSMIVAVLFCWWGSQAIAELTGASGIARALLGAVIAFVSAILSIPLGALLGTIAIRKEINERGQSAVSFAWFFAILFLVLQAIVDPILFVPLIIAPVFCGWLFYSMSLTTAAMWAAFVAPAVGFGVGVIATVGINDSGSSQ